MLKQVNHFIHCMLVMYPEQYTKESNKEGEVFPFYDTMYERLGKKGN